MFVCVCVCVCVCVLIKLCTCSPLISLTSNVQNVVVVGQPAPSPTEVVFQPPRAPDYLILSVVLFVVCFLHGMWQLHICLLPALIFSIVVSSVQLQLRYICAAISICVVYMHVHRVV